MEINLRNGKVIELFNLLTKFGRVKYNTSNKSTLCNEKYVLVDIETRIVLILKKVIK